jgi:hypothetical protein
MILTLLGNFSLQQAHLRDFYACGQGSSKVVQKYLPSAVVMPDGVKPLSRPGATTG